MPTPRDEISHAIRRWEGPVPTGPFSSHYMQWLDWDPGNWVEGPDGRRICVGTNYGVTPAVLAAHRGVRPWEITREIMNNLTLEEAADIGVTRFYQGTGLDLLPWGPATSALMDVGWGSGPRQAILFAQRLCGASADGNVGALTIEAYTAWIAKVGWEQACVEVWAMRQAFYEMLGRNNPKNYGPPQGAWRMRALGFKPNGSSDGQVWWGRWKNELPVVTAPASSVPYAPKPPAQLPPVAAAPVPAGESRTAQSAGVSGAATAAAAVADVIQQASSQVTAAAQIAGTIKWILIGLAIIGAAYAVYRVVQDRKVPT